MNAKTVKRLLEWWFKGADVAPGTMDSVLSTLALNYRTNDAFVKDCIRQCKVLKEGG